MLIIKSLINQHST